MECVKYFKSVKIIQEYKNKEDTLSYGHFELLILRRQERVDKGLINYLNQIYCTSM